MVTTLDASAVNQQQPNDLRSHLLREFLTPPTRKSKSENTTAGSPGERSKTDAAPPAVQPGESEKPAKTEGGANKSHLSYKSFFGDQGASYLNLASNPYLSLNPLLKLQDKLPQKSGAKRAEQAPDGAQEGKKKGTNQDKPLEKKEAGEPSANKSEEKKSISAPDGKGTYSKLENGNWQFTDASGKTSKSHPDFPDKAIKNVESQSDGSLKLTLEDGKIMRLRSSGARLQYPDEAAFNANHPNRVYRNDNTYKDVEWDGDSIKSFKSSDKKDRFYQVAQDQWSADPKAQVGWKGHIDINGITGDFDRLCKEPGANQNQRDI